MRRFVAVLVPLVVLATAGSTPAAADKGGSGPAGLLPDIQTVVPQHLGIQNQQQRTSCASPTASPTPAPGPWPCGPSRRWTSRASRV